MAKILAHNLHTTSLIGYFEIKLYGVWAFKNGEPLDEYIMESCNWFFDDCCKVLRGSQISPEELLLTLNSFNPSIQFTIEYNEN